MVDLEELLVPWFNIIRSLLLVIIILRRGWVVLVVCGPLNHLKGEGGTRGGKSERGSREGWITGEGKFEYT